MKFLQNSKHLPIIAALATLIFISLKTYDRFFTRSATLTILRKGESFSKAVFTLPIHESNYCGSSPPSVMIAMVFHTFESFGFDDDYNDRGFMDVLKMYQSVDYPKKCISLAFLTSDLTSFEESLKMMNLNFPWLGFSRATLIYKPFVLKASRETRHSDLIQPRRRRLLAEARNYLATAALQEEDAIFWLDADIIKLPSEGLIEAANAGRDILHMRCSITSYSNYDLNAWKLHDLNTEANWLHRDNRTYLHHFEDGDYDVIALDSVGGTNLYLKADLVRRGLHFPPFYLVGTTWGDKEGYDGIETEGLCYLAKSMGSDCWGMPHIEVRHSPN